MLWELSVTEQGGPRLDGPPGSAGLSGPEPLQQVAVDDLVLRGDHAVRVTLVRLERPVLDQLHRQRARVVERHHLVIVAVHD